MAVILPVFLMMVLGLIEASRLGMAAQLISAAAREGCRVATLASATNNDFVTKAVQDALAGSGISATPTISCGDGTSSVSATAPAGGTTITVTVSVPYSQIAWFAPVEYFQGVTVKASVTMSSERP
jgi:Flp pilus assembly protein TadG